MEKLHFDYEKGIALWWLKPYVLVTLLSILWTNFAYSQSNVWANSDRLEQSSKSQERNIETFFSIIENRNLRISNTSEKTIDVYVKRMNAELEDELLHNTEVIEKMDILVNILNTKYSKNISRDNYLLALQSALKILSNTEKYRWLNQFSDRFSSTFDINFENALQFVQYVNWLSHNWSLKTQKKAWTSVLQCIFEDLNNQTIYQYDWKNNLVNNEKPQTTIEQTDNQISITNDNDLNSINFLSNNLSLDKLNWISYEDVLRMVNSIKHEWLRNAVMTSLLNNDVIWAQRLLWMEINCDKKKYPGFVASKRIWKKELNLMEEHWQYMTLKDSQEVLSYLQSIEDEYKLYDENFQWYEPLSAYKKFLSWEWKFNNNWLPYCIVSKYDYTLYLFSADHKLILETPVLTWAQVWNEPNIPDKVKTTPWGFYTIWWIHDRTSKWKNLFALYHTDLLRLDPHDWQYLLEPDNNWNYKNALWIHWEWNLRWYKVVKWNDWKDRLVEVPRSELFECNESASHTTSGWCTNVQVKKFWILRNTLVIGSVVFYCFDDEIIDAKHLWYKFDDVIETIEHFGKKSKNVIQLETAELLNGEFIADRKQNHTNQSNWLFAHNYDLHKYWLNNSGRHNMKSMMDTKKLI